MFTRARQVVRLRSGRDLLVVFALTILLPGMLLAVFGARALFQERRLANQQIRERLDRAAELAVQDVQRELREWQTALEKIGQDRTVNAEALPDRIRPSVAEPGAGVVVFLGPPERRVWPEQQLLYQDGGLGTASPPEALPTGALAEAESLELRQKDYPRAALLYKRLLATAEPDQRARLLHRLARTYRKAGRDEEAFRAFRELESSQDRIGALPADLIAKYEICSYWAAQGSSDRLAASALELYRELVGGRWVLEKSRYLFYAMSARTWLLDGPTSPEEIARWTAIGEEKRSLADAVADLLDARLPPARSSDVPHRVVQTDTGTHLAFWRSDEAGSESRGIALVLAKSWLNAHVWPRTFSNTAREGFDVALLTPNGQVLFASTGADADARRSGQAGLAATLGLPDSDVPWRVQVWPRDPAALSADLARRQRDQVRAGLGQCVARGRGK